MNRWTFSFDRGRVLQLQRPKSKVDIMAGHVAQDTFAEIPPMTPGFWQIRPVIWTRGRWAEPQVPMQAVWHGRHLPRTFTVGQAFLTPDVAFGHLADSAALHQFDHATIIAGSVNLCAHL